MKISKATKIGDIVTYYPQTVEVFFRHGMHCIGCPASVMETVEDGCRGHGLGDKEIEDLIVELNKLVSKAGKGKAKK